MVRSVVGCVWTRGVRRVAWWALAPLTLIPFLLLGCGTFTTPQTNNAFMDVNIVATDDAFVVPDTAPAGLIRFTFVNQGKELHHAQFFKLKDGATSDQFLAALKAGGTVAARDYSSPYGGPNMTAPGTMSEVVSQLQPGTYMVVCLVHPKGEDAHFNQGMVKKLTVTGGAQATPGSVIKSSGEIRLVDMQFTIPAKLKSGSQTLHVLNNGAQPHAIEILKLAPGKTVDDARPYFKLDALDPQSISTLPFNIAGGYGTIPPHQDGYMMVNLDPGNYVLICPVTDATTGKQHFMLGMVTPFSVA
jgi:hypothetical protein